VPVDQVGDLDEPIHAASLRVPQPYCSSIFAGADLDSSSLSLLRIRLVPGLTRVPFNLSADWISKTVTINPPRLMPHEEWRLSLDIEAAAPIYAAVLWYLDDDVSWGLWQYEPSERIQLRLHFFAYDWRTSDEMHLSFGWRRIILTDARLKADPPNQTTVLVPPHGATGEIIPVCELRNHPVTAAVFTVARDDAEPRRRHRWRVRPELTGDLPADLTALSSGHQSGIGKRDQRPRPSPSA
jgi:hypothetical protein